MNNRAEEETAGHPRSDETPDDFRRTPPASELEEHPLDTPGGISSNRLMLLMLVIAVIAVVVLLLAYL